MELCCGAAALARVPYAPWGSGGLRAAWCWVPLSLGVCPGGGLVRVLGGGCWTVVLRARPSRDENEQRVVRRLSRARKAPRDLALRARMVELSWRSQRMPAIADELRCSPKTVCRWLHRFNRLGLQGLEDLGGQGRKRRITEAERSRIIGLVMQSPPGRPAVQADGELAAAAECGPPEWALHALAAEARRLGIEAGRSQVRRILLAGGCAGVAPGPGPGRETRTSRIQGRCRTKLR